MSKVYYKVVSSNLKSWAASSYLSCYQKLAIQYKLGEFVQADIEGSPLFVFKTLEDARDFLAKNMYPGLQIYECEVAGIRKMIPIFYDIMHNLSTVKEAANIYKQKKSLSKFLGTKWEFGIPLGTVAVNKVMLTKRVK